MSESKLPSYETGEADFTEHQAFYGSFKQYLVWVGLIFALVLMALTLVFASPASWILSLFITLFTGIGLGIFLKMKTAWYVTLSLLFGFSLFSGFFVVLVRSML